MCASPSPSYGSETATFIATRSELFPNFYAVVNSVSCRNICMRTANAFGLIRYAAVKHVPSARTYLQPMVRSQEERATCLALETSEEHDGRSLHNARQPRLR